MLLMFLGGRQHVPYVGRHGDGNQLGNGIGRDWKRIRYRWLFLRFHRCWRGRIVLNNARSRIQVDGSDLEPTFAEYFKFALLEAGNDYLIPTRVAFRFKIDHLRRSRRHYSLLRKN